MIKAKILIESSGQEVPIYIRNRQYKKLFMKLRRLSFWEKVKILFNTGKYVDDK